MKLRGPGSRSGNHRGGTVLQCFNARMLNLGRGGVQRFHQSDALLPPEIVKSGLGSGQKLHQLQRVRRRSFSPQKVVSWRHTVLRALWPV